MSWAAHELETYVLRKHTTAKVSWLGIIFGAWVSDMFTKLPVYGWKIGSFSLKASVPYKYHRGWPGVGFTHSLSFGLIVASVVLVLARNRAWFVGIIIGQASHVFTDLGDSVGTMVFFPGTTQRYTVGTWAYAAQQGRYGDAAAYYSSLGGAWDLLWVLIVLAGWKVLSRRFFLDHVRPADPAWDWMARRFGVTQRGQLALYRAFFIYGASRALSWTLWARLRNPRRGQETLDLTWGGPDWVNKVPRANEAWTMVLRNTAVGAAVFTVLVLLAWRLVVRRYWLRAT
ncbi:MAG: metal-dependent hydrolase [Actinobacteria bacterium]|nr:metal-dependent hydrolase [Actinomycetota bacterium]